MAPVLEYRQPDSRLTLGEGLSEYYASRPDLVRGRGMSPAAREFFRCHDAAHVVFGCDTTLANEAIVKAWSLLGTTAGLSLLRAYRLPESREIYAQLRWSDIIGATFRSLAALPLVAWRCSRMRRRWPWSEFEPYLGVPLAEIRRQFGIAIVLR
jgi:hypothetical protein